MFAIIVTEKGGEQRRHEYDKSEVTIGRVQGNDVVLPKGNVSKRHARIVLKDGKFIIVDLKSTNGTYVNGRKITSPLVVKDNDKIYIGDFILGVEGAGVGAAAGVSTPIADPPPPAPPRKTSPPPAPVPAASGPVAVPSPAPALSAAAAPPPVAPILEPPSGIGPAPEPIGPVATGRVNPPNPPSPPKPRRGRETGRSEPPEMPQATPSPAMPMSSSQRSRLVGAGAPPVGASRPKTPRVTSLARGVKIEPLDKKRVKMLELQAEIFEQAAEKLGLESISLEELADEELWQRAESSILGVVETMASAGEIPKALDQELLVKEALNETLGLGPLEDLLADDGIDEILVDRPDRIIIGSQGKLRGSGRGFSSDDSFRRVVERLVASSGYTIDETSPLIDVRLRDGSRLTAAVPPVAVRGACLALRKPRSTAQTLKSLIEANALAPGMGDFLETCVVARRNILVTGAPDSGKNAVVAALAAAAPEGERVVSVEEVAELDLGRDQWIALEARPGDSNGVPDVHLGMVLRSALRMRPDRLVVGDVRGAEAYELIQAMASSCDGTIVSVGGEGPAAGLSRLTSMARLAIPGAPDAALRELVVHAVDVVVHVARYADGVSRIASVYEVSSATDAGFFTRELFVFRGAAGGFVAAGAVPEFYAELEARGIPADTSIFR
jgi:pilus assembly protein CpaF